MPATLHKPNTHSDIVVYATIARSNSSSALHHLYLLHSQLTNTTRFFRRNCYCVLYQKNNLFFIKSHEASDNKKKMLNKLKKKLMCLSISSVSIFMYYILMYFYIHVCRVRLIRLIEFTMLIIIILCLWTYIDVCVFVNMYVHVYTIRRNIFWLFYV